MLSPGIEDHGKREWKKQIKLLLNKNIRTTGNEPKLQMTVIANSY